jgi:hypothetical protein
MKIAICFSGEPRFVEECYPLIKKNIIEVNSEIDLFVHTWYSEETSGKKLYSNSLSSFGESSIKKNIVEKIKDLYNPKSLIVENPKKFIDTNLNWGDSLNKYFGGGGDMISNNEFRKIKINNFYSFLYSNMRSILLKKEYELSNDFKYDYVVRYRFDNITRSPIIFSSFDNKILHYQEMGQPDRMISDWINFSNSENMDIFSSIFQTINYLSKISINNYNGFSPESLIRSVCDKYDIPSRSHSFGIELPKHGKINL